MAVWRIFVFLLVIWILEPNGVASQILNKNLQTAETTTTMSTSAEPGTNTTENTTATASGNTTEYTIEYTTDTSTVSGSICADTVLPQICQLLSQSQGLDSEELPTLVQNLYQSVQSHQEKIQRSAPTILAIIDILKETAAVGAVVTEPVMKNLLNTVDVLVSEDAFNSWSTLSTDISLNACSGLLGALDDLSASLEGEFSISTPRILLNRSRFHGSYKADLTPSVSLKIPPTNQVFVDFITTLTFSTLGVLLNHEKDPFSRNATTNADVLLIRAGQLQDLKVSVIFKKKDVSRYTHRKCVLWDQEQSGRARGRSYNGSSDNGSSYYGSSYYGWSDNGSSYYGWSYYGWSYYGWSYYGWSYYGWSDYGWSDYGWSDYGWSDYGWSDYGSSDDGSSNDGSSNDGWSYDRCLVSELTNNTVTCRCSGLSTFSVLGTDISRLKSIDLTIFSENVVFIYFGAWVNVFCVLICLVIEGCVWKSITTNSTALMRHVTIINTSICLLVGDILLFFALYFRRTFAVYWKCFSLVFFWQLFDLSLFFWMLVSCLLLFYRTSFVFSNMSKAKMFAIGFCLGYGAPLLVMTITVASTAPKRSYVMFQGFCMLDWRKAMTVLSLALPVLTIALVNAVLMIVVLFNIKRSTKATNKDADERRMLVARLVFLLISFLLFGLTRGLTLGMLQKHSYSGVYIAFAVSNSLQGLSILLFGPLYDSKIRLIICRKFLKTPDQEKGTTLSMTRSS